MPREAKLSGGGTVKINASLSACNSALKVLMEIGILPLIKIIFYGSVILWISFSTVGEYGNHFRACIQHFSKAASTTCKIRFLSGHQSPSPWCYLPRETSERDGLQLRLKSSDMFPRFLRPGQRGAFFLSFF